MGGAADEPGQSLGSAPICLAAIRGFDGPFVFWLAMKLPELLCYRFRSLRARIYKGRHGYGRHMDALGLEGFKQALSERAYASLTNAERKILRARRERKTAASK